MYHKGSLRFGKIAENWKFWSKFKFYFSDYMRYKIDDLYENVFDDFQKLNADEMKTNTFFDH